MYNINKNYRAKYYGKSRKASDVQYIVIHYTANGGTKATAKGNANYFATTTRKASAHYIVDQNVTIYQCVDDLDVAWSVGDNNKYTNGGAQYKKKCTNGNSISIEMVSQSKNGIYFIPENTIKRAQELTFNLMQKYNINIKNVLRHYDVTGKLCPRPFIDTNEWNDFKRGLESDIELITTTNILVDNKEITVERILKNGKNYVLLVDLPKLVSNVKVSYDTNKKIPTITTKQEVI